MSFTVVVALISGTVVSSGVVAGLSGLDCSIPYSQIIFLRLFNNDW